MITSGEEIAPVVRDKQGRVVRLSDLWNRDPLFREALTCPQVLDPLVEEAPLVAHDRVGHLVDRALPLVEALDQPHGRAHLVLEVVGRFLVGPRVNLA